MTNPNYATLLPQIAAESNPTTKQNLINQCYVFTTALTDEEKQLFEYVQQDYVQNNPGNADDSSFSAYAGVYYNSDGETT